MIPFAVFGNPIQHSKSSEIYALFAKEIGIKKEYELKLIVQEGLFNHFLLEFFKLGGLGANITSPFKEKALPLCDELTERATIACSVNTIKKKNNGMLLGENTDGIGFMSDLKRLCWVDNNRVITERLESTTRILLIGSGGSAKGVLPILLNLDKCHVYVVNRTFLRAEKLVRYYYSKGFNNISYISLDALFCNSITYHLIINATTSSMYNSVPKIPPDLITSSTKCYDLFYQKTDTSFVMWCKKYGSCYVSDGLGMLVGQAAHSFCLWHNYLPDITIMLNRLRYIL